LDLSPEHFLIAKIQSLIVNLSFIVTSAKSFPKPTAKDITGTPERIASPTEYPKASWSEVEIKTEVFSNIFLGSWEIPSTCNF